MKPMDSREGKLRPVHRRATNRHVAVDREARQLVSPFASKIARWHEQSARLQALFIYLKAHERPVTAAMLDDLATLSAEVAAARQEFAEKSSVFPSTVLNHGRYQDVQKALVSAQAATGRCHIAMLDVADVSPSSTERPL